MSPPARRLILLWLAALLICGAGAGSATAAGSATGAGSATAAGTHSAAPGPAAAHYRQSLGREGFSAHLLFDLGNVWLRAGRPGWAILNYERAAWLAPRNAAIAARLTAAQERAGVMPPPGNAWDSGLRRLRLDTYTWMGIAGLAALCAGVVLLRLRSRPRRWAGPLLALGALLLCLAADAAVLYWPELARAVVVQGPAPVRIAPAAAAASSFALREGELVYLQQRFNAFQRVRTPDGRSGWVSAAQLAPVLVSATEAQRELPRALSQTPSAAGS